LNRMVIEAAYLPDLLHQRRLAFEQQQRARIAARAEAASVVA
jgi:hypothetical protein